MKLYFRLILAALAATAVLTACTKEITPGKVDTDPKAPAAEGSRVIAVSFAPQTKTSLANDGLQPRFNDGDSILISNGEALDTCEVKIIGKKATISTDLTGPLTAAYPAKFAKIKDGEFDGFDIPAMQSGKFSDANLCFAEMEGKDESSLHFENCCPVLKFYVDESIGVTSIKITSGLHIAGNSMKITVEAPEGKTLYDVMPSEGQNRRICYVALDGKDVHSTDLKFGTETTTQGPVERTPANNVLLKEGHMYNAFIPYYIEVNGQKWAYCNIGAFLPEEPGEYFAWGEIQGHKANDSQTAFEDSHDFSWATCPFNGNNSTYNEVFFNTVKDEECPDGMLSAKNDAATDLWGAGWRMPTKEEYEQLLSATGTTASGFVDGVLSISGTALKFPASGSGIGTKPLSLNSYGRYWSLTLNSENPRNAYYLSFKNGEVCTTEDYRYYGQSVRPVFGDLPPQDFINLSEDGCANCYIVTEPGIYCFDATVKGNSSESVGTPSSASIVWKSFGTDKKPTDGDLIYNVQLKNNQVHFTATGQKGNVVLAAKDGSGNILWSWHIWLTDTPVDQVYANSAGTMMDRNLGAASTSGAGALGLLYQWGRKDPFPGSSSVSSSVQAAYTLPGLPCKSAPQTPDWSVANPDTFIKGTIATNYDWTTQDDGLWAGSKTKYDPCPAGYRVPDGGDTGIWNTAGFDKVSRGPWLYGYDFPVLEGGGAAWYPAAGLIDGEYGTFGYAGSHGGYWSCNTLGYVARFLTFGSNFVNSADHSSRADAQSVRCMKIQD